MGSLMARPNALTPEQWTQVRRRWEGSDRLGFDWLAKEIAAAFPGITISRQGVSVRAAREGWEKGGPASEPLTAPVAQQTALVAQQTPGVAQHAPPPGPGPAETASEVVDPRPAPPQQRGPGRPTSYRAEFAQQIVAFFDKEPFTDVPVPQPSGLVKMQRMAVDLPMLATFARSINVSLSTLTRWATSINGDGAPTYPDFAAAYARARELHEAFIVRASAQGAYEPRTCMFLLKNQHGWQDQPAPREDHAAVSKDELDRRFGQRMEAARQRQMAVLEERRALRRLADEAAGVGEADVPGLGYTPELAAGAADGQVQEAGEARG
jgi:hypothetical protein